MSSGLGSLKCSLSGLFGREGFLGKLLISKSNLKFELNTENFLSNTPLLNRPQKDKLSLKQAQQ
jgi:hypothetical protein